MEANSTGGQGSRRAVAPSDDDDDDPSRISFQPETLLKVSFNITSMCGEWGAVGWSTAPQDRGSRV